MSTEFDTILRKMSVYDSVSENKDFYDTLHRIYQKLLQMTDGRIEMRPSNKNSNWAVKFLLLDNNRRKWFDVCNYIYDEMVTTFDNNAYDLMQHIDVIVRNDSVEVLNRMIIH